MACVSVCFVVAGCNQAAPKKLSPEAEKQNRLDWNVKTTIGAYTNSSYGDPAWDEFAKAAMTKFADSRADHLEPGENWTETIATNCAAAVQAGCDDPMVRYLYIRFSMSQTNSREAFMNAFCKAEREMQNSSYPDIRKFYVSARAVEQMYYVLRYNRENVDPNTFNQTLGDMKKNTLALLRDKAVPSEELYQACELALRELSGNKNEYPNFYQEIEKALMKNRPQEATTWLLKGGAYIDLAWLARGSGYASSVTDEGQKQFQKDLGIAEEALNRAWKLNPNDPGIPLKMMTVALGQGNGRDQMETWFSRGMAISPDNYELCHSKLYYLEPKWYGSAEDMLAFGRECVQSPTWGGSVPLILVEAHHTICYGYVEESERTNYWKQPEVWADMKSAYEKFFQINPIVGGDYRGFYAWYAVQAGDWKKVNELIPKMTAIDYDVFGGKEKFDAIMQQAPAGVGGADKP